MSKPFTFWTVTRDGGDSCRRLKLRGGAFQIESARAESSAVSEGGGVRRRRGRNRPSSSTSTVMVTGPPTDVSRTSGPSRTSAGGWLARISGLLEAAPRAPVSDMTTVLSTM